jgi:excisionase family DNA binding protein
MKLKADGSGEGLVEAVNLGSGRRGKTSPKGVRGGWANYPPYPMAAPGRTTLYSLLRQGSIPTVKVGRLRRTPWRALERYVESLQEEAI